MKKKRFLEDILAAQAIRTVFQPIVSLDSSEIFAYEALSRITIPTDDDMNIEKLFHIAYKQNKLWELDKLCRLKALENSCKIPENAKLFINVNPHSIQDPEFKSGFTVEKLKEYGMQADNIVIEITEHSAVLDIEGFALAIRHYQDQGFKIAIDDFGTGYSGLSRVCALSPQYIKLDRSLISGSSSNVVKRSAISSVIDFCNKFGIQVIAEGVETEDELQTMMSMGTGFVQGYLLSKPAPPFAGLTDECRQLISTVRKRSKLHYNLALGEIGTLGSIGHTVFCDAPSLPVYTMLKDNADITDIFVLDRGMKVCGILPRQHVFMKFGGEYGYNLSRRLNTGALMIKDIMTVDEHCSIDKVSELAMKRNTERIYDAIAITREGKYLSAVTVRELLLTSVKLQLRRARDASPLTGLPGNSEIQEMIRDTCFRAEPWAIIYIDLNNFKAYNDAYGFSNGDSMIKTLSSVITERASTDTFVGHIGGDDFVMITKDQGVEEFCNKIINSFHDMLEPLYSKKDWQLGYIISKDRNGFTQRFGIATLAVAVITNREGNPVSINDLSERIASTKKACKHNGGNSIIVD